MAEDQRFMMGNFTCNWRPQSHGVAVTVTLGEGLGTLPVGAAFLPGATPDRAQQVAESYCTNLIRGLQQECTKALSSASPAASPKSPAPVKQAPPTPAASAPDETVKRRPFIAPPEPFSTLVRFGNEGLIWDHTKWRDILIEVGCYLAEHCPDKFQAALTDAEFQGRKRRSLSSDRDGMRLPFPVTILGNTVGYVETAFGAGDILSLARKMMDFCEVDSSSFWYECRSESKTTA